MSKRPTAARIAVVAIAAIIVACGGEQALVVSPRLDGAPPLGAVGDPAGALVKPIRRERALSTDDSFSFDVGPGGTVVRRPGTGLTINVPAGAVATTTHITVTALRGAPLAYRFAPHGLQFGAPVRLTQSLYGLRVNQPSFVPQLFAGYFADDSLATDAIGNARVIEILPIQVDVRNRTVTLEIRHFSGYTVASAASDSLSEAR